MPVLLEKIRESPLPLVWLDDLSYSERILGIDRRRWLEVNDLIAMRRKLAGLLRPAVTVLPLGLLAQEWLSGDARLQQAIAAKKRAIVPLRTLLDDDALRARLIQLAKALRSTFSTIPLVLALPSPRRWVADIYRSAFGSEAPVEVGMEEADSASVYVAQFLRGFSESGVDIILLIEDAGSEPASEQELNWYRPVLNVAGHYRWDVGVQLPGAAGFTGLIPGIDFLIAPRALPACVSGITTPAAFWSGAPAPALPAGGFRFAEIPAACAPEQVLDRLAVLRAA